MEQPRDPMRFSIVVPAYNEAAYLGRALDSLLHQDFNGRYEVIVVDNNSTDGTAAVAAQYGVSVVKEPQQGVCAARQRGVDCATGEIIISTDADTTQPRDWLRTFDARFAESERVVAVAGPCRYQDPSWWAKAFPVLLFGLVAKIYALTGFVFYVSATNIAVRRTAFPGYDLKLTQGGDELDLVRRLRRRGHVSWERQNVVTTSARRLQRGLLYNIFVSFFVYYLLAYWFNRLSQRQAFGMAPAFRQERRRSLPLVWASRRVVLGILLLGLTSLGFATGASEAAVDSLAQLWKGP
ncbi:MAG TPA: glycosyltransferase family A protein [Propionibacteriaceae bacterium]|nr:glycosyltransferase family A protein [Propionibacteriaceae bacterium]